LTQRWAPQTRYTLRHNTASIMKGIILFATFVISLLPLSVAS